MTKMTPAAEEFWIDKLESVGHKREDILVAFGRWYEGAEVEHETVACWECNAIGFTRSTFDRCRGCFGRGERIRIALPKR